MDVGRKVRAVEGVTVGLALTIWVDDTIDAVSGNTGVVKVEH